MRLRNNTFGCEQILCGRSMTFHLTLYCLAGALLVILLVLVVLRRLYLNISTVRRKYAIWDMNGSEWILRHPRHQDMMFCQVLVISMSHSGQSTSPRMVHNGERRVYFLNCRTRQTI